MSQISIHDQIFNYLKTEYGDDLVSHPRTVFYNYQKKGLRLTTLGYRLMRHDFISYEYAIDAGVRVTAGNIIQLDRGMSWPYYITQDKLVLFSEDDSVIFKLVGGFRNWIQSIK